MLSSASASLVSSVEESALATSTRPPGAGNLALYPGHWIKEMRKSYLLNVASSHPVNTAPVQRAYRDEAYEEAKWSSWG